MVHERVAHESVTAETPLIVPGEGADLDAMAAYAQELAFMAEPVEIMILPNQDQQSDSTRLAPFGVNGKDYYLFRGEWKTVPRFVAEIIITSKVEAWHFSFRHNNDGSTSDVSQMHRVQRFPYQFRDNTEKGMRWYDRIKDAHR